MTIDKHKGGMVRVRLVIKKALSASQLRINRWIVCRLPTGTIILNQKERERTIQFLFFTIFVSLDRIFIPRKGINFHPPSEKAECGERRKERKQWCRWTDDEGTGGRWTRVAGRTNLKRGRVSYLPSQRRRGLVFQLDEQLYPATIAPFVIPADVPALIILNKKLLSPIILPFLPFFSR